MSRPRQSAVAASSTTISPPSHGSVRPADRAEAKKRSSSTGKLALGQQRAHDAADLAGGADDADAHGAASATGDAPGAAGRFLTRALGQRTRRSR